MSVSNKKCCHYDTLVALFQSIKDRKKNVNFFTEYTMRTVGSFSIGEVDNFAQPNNEGFSKSILKSAKV